MLTDRDLEIVKFIKEWKNVCRRETLEDIFFPNAWGLSTCRGRLNFLISTQCPSEYRINRYQPPINREQYIYYDGRSIPKNYDHSDLIAKVYVYFKYVIEREIVEWEREPNDFKEIRPDLKLLYLGKDGFSYTLYVEIEKSHTERIENKIKVYQDLYNIEKAKSIDKDYIPFELLYFYKRKQRFNIESYNGFSVKTDSIDMLRQRPSKLEVDKTAVGAVTPQELKNNLRRK